MNASESKGTVFLVDDDPSVRKSVCRLLRSLGYRVEAYGTITDYYDTIANEREVGCLLLDMCLPDGHGLGLQECLMEVENCPPIVFITGNGEVNDSILALKRGAVDYLLKPFTEEELVGAVDEAIRRDTHNRSSQSEIKDIRQRIERLTPREYEILRHIIAGRLNKQIAFDLGISEKTVKVHRGRVLDKMEVHSVPALVYQAEKVGIAPSSSPS